MADGIALSRPATPYHFAKFQVGFSVFSSHSEATHNLNDHCVLSAPRQSGAVAARSSHRLVRPPAGRSAAGLELESAEDRALFTGDLVHSPVQIPEPDHNSCFCDPAAATATRRRLLAWAVEQKALDRKSVV